jgi:hypothetical protein
VDARGVTALTDGARWFATLRLTDNGALELMQAKSNYSRPWANPVPLERGPGGILRALDEGDAQARQAIEDRACDEARAHQVETDLATILEAFDAVGGEATSKDALTALGRGRGLTRARARDALEVALARGLIVAEGETSARRFRRVIRATSATSADSRRTSAGESASPAVALPPPFRGEAAAAGEADLFRGASATSGPAEDAPSVDDGGTPAQELAWKVGR